MSIADDEAEKAYPTRYWEGTHVKKQFYCDTDDLQEAYLRGRNAPSDAAVLFSVLFFALVVCLGWAEATAETQQTFDMAELK